MAQSDDLVDRLSERDLAMWDDWVNGSTQQEIADKYDMSQSNVSLRLKAVKDAIPDEEKSMVLRRHLDVITAMTKELLLLAKAPPTPAYSNGRRMTMPNDEDPDEPGEQVWDHSARLAAMDRIDKFLIRESKLLGLDSAEKQEITAVVEHKPAEVLDLIAQAKARSEAEEAVLRGERQAVEDEAREEYGSA